MKMILLCHFDKKLGVYTAPFQVQEASDETIIEQTRRMCANPHMPVEYFDYDLYKIGVFDDKTAFCDIEEKPIFLVSLGDYRHLAPKKEEVEHEVV